MGSSYYHGVDISASLPRGCGYSLGIEGGDPERDDIKLLGRRADPLLRGTTSHAQFGPRFEPDNVLWDG